MTERVQTPSSNGAGADIDAVETSEWLEALDAVVSHDGPARAKHLLTRVIERAQQAGTGPIATLNTPYVNTIPAEPFLAQADIIAIVQQRLVVSADVQHYRQAVRRVHTRAGDI